MEVLTKYFSKNTLLVNFIILLAAFLGLKSLVGMQKEGFPSATLKRVFINTVYPGASARDVELNVTIPIEDELRDISNVKETLSTSSEGISNITVVGDEDLSEEEFSRLYDDIGDALGRINNLPKDLESLPTYTQFTSANVPVIEIALDGPEKELRSFIPFFVNELKRNSGISKISEVGFPDEELVIEVNHSKMNKYQVDFKLIVSALKSRNIEGSGGTLESYIGEKKIVAFNKFNSIEDILNTNIRKSVNGKGVKIGDVAKISNVPKDLKLRVRNNGNFGVSLVVVKKSNADLLNTIDKIVELTKTINKPENVRIKLLNDKSVLTRDRLKLLSSNALIGIILVSIILFFILGGKTAFWTAFSIPLVLISTFIFLPFFGITLNSISLAGFVLVLGMLVDDAIVVAEQVNKEKENGLEGKEPAWVAIKKVWKPITGASITTILAYYPISQLGGLPGKFVWMIPTVVGIALFLSLFDSFFLLPNHLTHGRTEKITKAKYFSKLEDLYKYILHGVIRFRYLFLIFFILIFVGTGYVAKNLLRKNPFPQDASEGFTIELTGTPGTSMRKAEENLKIIEKHILSLPKGELSGISSRIGTQSKRNITERGTEAHLGIIFVYLSPFSKRKRKSQEIMDGLKVSMDKTFKKLDIRPLFELQRIGPPLGRPFEIRVSSNNDKIRKSKAADIKKQIGNLKGVLNINDDQVFGKKELNLILNYDYLSRVGLTVEDVLQTIRLAFDGQVITDYIKDNRPIDIRVRLDKDGRGDTNFIKKLKIINKRGYLIPLKKIASFKEEVRPSQISHINGDRAIVIFGQVDNINQTPGSIFAFAKKNFPSTKDLQITYAGQPVENRKIFKNLFVAGITAVFAVFLVISLIFNSISKSLIVISAIPFGIVGIIFGVWSHGMVLSMFVGISLVGLSGIIVNDSLVMVFTISESLENFDIDKLIEATATRLRPVLLTTITTVLGLFPTAYGLGGQDPFISPMCLALMYGLMFGTFVTLALIPILYCVRNDVLRIFLKPLN